MTTAHTATAPTKSTTGSPPGEPCIMVIFGAGGDLTKRLLMPALYNLQLDGLLPKKFALIGFDFKEITTEDFRASHGVGFQHLRFMPAFGQTQALSTEDLKEFRQAIVRLKEKQGLYIQDNFRVAFIGKSLFRATIELPANVTVGPFETRVYLFREEKLLSQYTVRLNLEREGLERHLHRFAFGYPTLYGLMTVAIALAAGLIASTVFRRAAH